MSLISRPSTGSNSTPGSKHQSFSNLYNKEKEKGIIETCATIENVPPSSNSSHSSNSGDRLHSYGRHKNELWKNSTQTAPNSCSLNLGERHKHRNTVSSLRTNVQASSAPAAEVAQASEITGRSYETQLKNPRAWSPVRSVGSVVGMEAHPESDLTAFDAESAYHGSDVFLGDDDDHTGLLRFTIKITLLKLFFSISKVHNFGQSLILFGHPLPVELLILILVIYRIGLMILKRWIIV